MEITPARTDKTPPFRALVHPPPDHLRRGLRPSPSSTGKPRPTTGGCWVIAGWGLNIALSLAWYLFDCDDECNYRNR